MKKLGLTLLALGLIGFVLLKPAETAIIIQMGIRTFKILSLLPFVFIGAGAVFAVAGFVPNMRRLLEARRNQKNLEKKRSEGMKPKIAYAAGRIDPRDIRRMLENLALSRPDLGSGVEQCLTQMDVMDRRQAKLEELIAINDAGLLLNSTIDLLDDVEQYLCGNMRYIINRGIVSDSDVKDVYTEDSNYKTDEQVIEDVLARNKDQLDRTQKLLADLAQYVSEKRDVPETTVDSWIAVIRSSMKKEGL
jgi:hypothetical protein